MVDRTAITLYLASWQKRMILDYVKDAKVSNKIIVSIDDKKKWVMYIQPPELVVKGSWNLYLTDEQINKVTEVLGLKTKISALNISPEMLKSKAISFG